MRIARAAAWLGLLAMTAVILNGFINGSFSEDGAELLANPWGIVSLVDLYVGFILFSLWIIFREENFAVTIIWVVLMMILGFFTASLYIIIALRRSRGDWLEFFLGARKTELLERSR